MPADELERSKDGNDLAENFGVVGENWRVFGVAREQPRVAVTLLKNLDGGLVAGQMCLLSGAPGSGKSTLVLAIADSVAKRLKRPVLYISGEESVEQIAIRAQRIGASYVAHR